MKVTVIGVGLIGGSMVIDLRTAGIATHIRGVDRNDNNLTLARQLGLIDTSGPLREMVGDADVVLLAIPVNAVATVLPEVLDAVADHTVVIDTGSTKNAICKAVRSHPRRRQFVAAHPIAGTENSGPEAALAGLFTGKTNILCEQQHSSKETVDTAMRVFEALGMVTIFMEPEEHDRHVAYVSHLSHVSSFLLGQTVLDIERDEKNIAMLAGSGFASTVRLAKSSPDMWAPIFEQNMEYLSQALQEYILHLQRFQYHLMKRDTTELHKTMTEANAIRRILHGIEQGTRATKAKAMADPSAIAGKI